MCLAAQAPRCRLRLTSNVRRRNHRRRTLEVRGEDAGLRKCPSHPLRASSEMAKHKLPPWLRPKTQRQVVVGVTWYTEDEWHLVKGAADDPERFEQTYADWLAMAEESSKSMLAAGIVARPITIVASELLAWCLAHGKPNNATSRAEYVSHVQAERHERDA